MVRDRGNQVDADSKKPHIPNRNQSEMLAYCVEILGGEHINAKAEDGQMYLATIRGKIKKRMWVRQGDLIILVPWDFESKPREGKKPRAYVTWRYTRTQQSWLEAHNYINQEFMRELQNI